ncbi:MAG TPA: TraB/GumN family protein [Verrucomicrobiales bacterium]|nr:TraB/GumN family protein [Verrucomicrobiales bacterium]HIL69021.1 TraB/GumN family protein [Verrucomicrobiota bacterium]
MTNSKFILRTIAMACFLWTGIDAKPQENAHPKVTGQKSFLWQIDSGGSKVYLLGSIHLAKSDIYPLNASIESAFAQSEYLAVEADVLSPAKAAAAALLMASKISYGPEDNLKNHLSKDGIRFFETAVEATGMPRERLLRYKPWFIAMSVASIQIRKMGLSPEHGVDFHFLKKAQGVKPILELEGAKSQIELLDGFTDSEQEAFLIGTLTSLKEASGFINQAIEAWITGDDMKMEQLIFEGMETTPDIKSFYEKFLFERNLRMLDKIRQYLEQKDTTFVIVGAAHLVGEKGILKLLVQQGFTPRQL